MCDAWTDRSNQKILSIDITEAKKQFDKQAQEVSAKTSYSVKSFVLDARLK